MPESHTTVSLGGKRSFSVVLGSIVEADVDVIVNAANSRLAHGGGVAGVISRAAGPGLDEASRAWLRREGPVPVGGVAVTAAGHLPFEAVIHAVGPRQGEGDEEEKLTSAVASALDAADERGWRSVAFPAISAGIFGVPYDVCARAYVAGVRRHFRETPDSTVTDIRICLYDPDPDLLEAVEEAMEAGS